MRKTRWLAAENREKRESIRVVAGHPTVPAASTLSITRPCANVGQAETAISAATAVVRLTSPLILLLLPKKSLLNLREDLVEPLLGAVSSLLVVLHVRLKLRDPVFGRTQFQRELLSKFEGVLTVRLGYTRRLMQQT
jgi:hypothetical protein